jgi:hypothetical protein
VDFAPFVPIQRTGWDSKSETLYVLYVELGWCLLWSSPPSIADRAGNLTQASSFQI